MRLDKQAAARRLIHAAIRNVSSEDDPLAAHVLIVGAFDLIRQYAAKKDLQLKSDFLARLPPGVAREAINGLKLIYNFVRHSDRDPDGSVDISTLTPFTDVFIEMTGQMYREAFESETQHMQYFRVFACLQHPKLLTGEKGDEFSALPEVQSLRTQPRARRMETLRQIFQRPELRREFEF
jgi:hypothetical protein